MLGLYKWKRTSHGTTRTWRSQHYFGTISRLGQFKENFRRQFGEINQEQFSEAKLRTLKQGNQPCSIYSLNSELTAILNGTCCSPHNSIMVSAARLEDALVHFDTLLRITAMDMAYSYDNRLLKDSRTTTISSKTFIQLFSSTPITFRFRNQQQPQRFFEPKQSANTFYRTPSSTRPKPSKLQA
ncbi:hypothetical protein BASA83_013437 [Batrachochytrium salamandrivorans]|nr:hypothetical protein BASA83_013437 [Batrachochytrium salamandrivorans]